MTKRRSITTAMRLRIWAAHDGTCHLCGLRIKIGEQWDVEHVKPLWLGGEDTESNMSPSHKACHAPKTAQEATDRAKTNRQAAKHIGATRPKAKIRSRGFQKRERTPKPSLPPRQIYVEESK